MEAIQEVIGSVMGSSKPCRRILASLQSSSERPEGAEFRNRTKGVEGTIRGNEKMVDRFDSRSGKLSLDFCLLVPFSGLSGDHTLVCCDQLPFPVIGRNQIFW